jgi:anaerobic dimethyl sulfoxide reductase subunit B (iron-sulfur subunit)
VYEVSGGAWQKNGEAWNNTVFAYNISVACHHCAHPKCAGVCPTGAYIPREDGIVFLDTTKCMGCGYCAWACPYGVPQYNPESGSMTKCDFCIDQLDQGLPPACVAACPMRVLNYAEAGSVQEGALWEMPSDAHPYPLPNYSHTEPHLAIRPHPAMSTSEKKFVANREEIQPRELSGWEDVPLIVFTLLAQMAVGGFWAMSWIFSASSRLLPSLLVGFCLVAGMLASFAHLGRQKNAWRALSRWRKSSLSREVLFAGLFGWGCLFTVLEIVLWQRSTFEGMAVPAIFGIGFIYNMAQVYRFPAAPGWNTWRTDAGFMVSALLLGLVVMSLVFAYESTITAHQVSSDQWIMIGSIMIISLLTQLALMRKGSADSPFQAIRVGLIIVGIALIATGFLFTGLALWLSILVFLIVLAEEGLGRWLFYRSRL